VKPVTLANCFHDPEEFLGRCNLRSVSLVFPKPLDQTALSRDPPIGGANVVLNEDEMTVIHARQNARWRRWFLVSL
jgi:hypothetical protein